MNVPREPIISDEIGLLQRAVRLPNDTAARLWILFSALLTILGFAQVTGNLYEFAPEISACLADASTAVPDIQTTIDLQTWHAVFEPCVAPFYRNAALKALQPNGTCLLIGAGLSTLGPRLMRKRRQVPLSSVDKDKVVSTAVIEAIQRLRPKHIPTLHFDGRSNFPAAIGGLPRKPAIAFGPHMFSLVRQNRDAFDAIVFHELAHLRAEDLATSYTARVAFRVIFITTLIFVPILAVFLLFITTPLDALLAFPQAAVILFISYAGLRTFDRQREFYADAQAALAMGSSDGIRTSIASPGDRPHSGIFRVFRSHPTGTQRLQALRQPSSALSLSPWSALATGLVAGLLFPSLANYLTMLWYGTEASLLALWFGGAAGGLLLGRVLSTGIWRNVHLDLLERRRPRRGLLLGLTCSAGVLAGGFLPFGLVTSIGVPLLDSAAMALVVVSVMSGLSLWVHLCARWFLSARVRQGHLDPGNFQYRIFFWLVRLTAMIAGAVLFAALYEFSLLIANHPTGFVSMSAISSWPSYLEHTGAARRWALAVGLVLVLGLAVIAKLAGRARAQVED